MGTFDLSNFDMPVDIVPPYQPNPYRRGKPLCTLLNPCTHIAAGFVVYMGCSTYQTLSDLRAVELCSNAIALTTKALGVGHAAVCLQR